MLRRAWTLVVGYGLAYATKDFIYQDNVSVQKFFPAERIQHASKSFLVFGYAAFLLGLTEIASWIVNKSSAFINRRLYNGDITGTILWIIYEIIYWNLVANASILMWADIGEYYNGKYKKMFGMGAFFGLTTQIIHLELGW